MRVIEAVEERGEEIKKLLSGGLSGLGKGLLSYEGKGLRLEGYQERFLESRDKFFVTSKSRRVGWSFCGALKSFLRAMLWSRGNYMAVFVSRNMKEAADKIHYVRDFWEGMSPEWRDSSDRVVELNNIHSIGWRDSGKRRYEIRSYPSRQIRGPGSDVFFDEMAHAPGSSAIYHSALPIVARGPWIFQAGSTPNGDSGAFYDIVHKSEVYEKQLVYWWECPELCTDVEGAKVEARLMSLSDRVSRFATAVIQEQYRELPEDWFRQEYEVDFLSLGESFIGRELLDFCRFEPFPVRFSRTDFEDERDMEFIGEGAGSIVEEHPELSFRVYNIGNDVVAGVTSLLGGIDRGEVEGRLYLGLDPGFDCHQCSFTVVEDTGVLIPRLVLGYNKIKPTQVMSILDELYRLPIVMGRFDSTGRGFALEEEVRGRPYNRRLTATNFSSSIRGRNLPELMAGTLKTRMEKKEVGIPDYQDCLRQIRSVRELRSPSGRIQLRATSEGNRHGDFFWSLALACFCSWGKSVQTEAPRVGKEVRLNVPSGMTGRNVPRAVVLDNSRMAVQGHLLS